MAKISPAYNELAEFLRISSRFTFLIGAGASLSSGGATTAQIARDVLRGAGRYRDDFDADEEALAEAFFLYVSRLGGRVRYDVLSRYFESLFPNIGYLCLAKIIESGVAPDADHGLKAPPTILTTNFDYLIEGALAKWSSLLPGREFNAHVLGVADDVLEAVRQDKRRLKIIKVYGDVYAQIMPFGVEETRQWPEPNVKLLREHLADPLLVIGYSASDGLGDLLLESRVKSPIWWVGPTSPLDATSRRFRQPLKDLIEGRNGGDFAGSRVFAGDDGDFDRFMSSLYDALFGKGARERLEREYLPQLLAGRPREPFEGARPILRALLLRLRGRGPVARATLCAEASVSDANLVRLLRLAREIDPRQEIVESEAGVSVRERTMTHAEKLRLNHQDKVAIGRKAAGLPGSGDVVLMDGGTTTLEVAWALAERCRRDPAFSVTVVTNSVEIARLADAGNPRLRLWLASGAVRPESLGTTWQGPSETARPLAEASLREVLVKGLGKDQSDFAFVGSTGIGLKEGFCVLTDREGASKWAMLSLSRRKVVVADSSKFRASYPGWYSFYPLGPDVTVITDASDDRPDDFRDLVNLVLALPT